MAQNQKKAGKVNSGHAVVEQHVTTDQADSEYNDLKHQHEYPTHVN